MVEKLSFGRIDCDYIETRNIIFVEQIPQKKPVPKGFRPTFCFSLFTFMLIVK